MIRTVKLTKKQIEYQLVRSITDFPSIHIISRGSKWAVYKSKSRRAWRIFKHKEVAFLFANVVANNSPFIYVHNKNGEVEFRTKPLLVGQILRYNHEEIKKL